MTVMERFDVHTENKFGEWVPAIPGPFQGFRKKCFECGRHFWTYEGYEGHFALSHILGLDKPKDQLAPGEIPSCNECGTLKGMDHMIWCSQKTRSSKKIQPSGLPIVGPGGEVD